MKEIDATPYILKKGIMNKVWTVELESEWRCTHPYEFETMEEAVEFYENAENGDLGAVVDVGNFSPDHTSELINFGAQVPREVNI